MEAVLDYSKILDTVPCGICQVLLDTDLTMLYANQFYYKIYGYTPQSAKEKGFSNAKFILPESDYLYIKREVFQHIRNGDREFQLEYRSEHSSGKLMWLLGRGFLSGTAGPHDLCSGRHCRQEGDGGKTAHQQRREQDCLSAYR